jgi:hypothetical protein
MLYIYIKKKAAIFISSYKSQQSIGNLNDYHLNAIATTANLHWPYKEHLTLKNITTRYHQQIFQPTRKAVIMLNTQYIKYHIWILSQ